MIVRAHIFKYNNLITFPVMLTEVFGNVISIEIIGTVWKLQPTNLEYIPIHAIVKQPKMVQKVTLDVTSYSLMIYIAYISVLNELGFSFFV